MLPETLTPGQAREQLENARREAAEAATLGDQLADRVRDGDTDVTAEQLGAQRQLAELAELRITAAERKLKAALDADLDARARALAGHIGDLIDDDSTEEIVTAAMDVTEAIGRLLTLSGQRDDAIRQLADQAVLINGELGRGPHNPWPSRTGYGFMGQNAPGQSVSLDGKGHVEAIRAGHVLGAILAAALAGRSTDRHYAGQVLEGVPESVGRFLAGVPGLSEAMRYDRAAWDSLPARVRNEAARQGRAPLPEAAGVEMERRDG
jgi:hypothetical protein